MPTLEEIRKEIARRKAIEEAKRDMQRYDREKSKAQRELFELKHKKAISLGKNILSKGRKFSNWAAKTSRRTQRRSSSPLRSFGGFGMPRFKGGF